MQVLKSVGESVCQSLAPHYLDDFMLQAVCSSSITHYALSLILTVGLATAAYRFGQYTTKRTITLTDACERGDDHVVQAFVKSLGYRRDGNTPLHLALKGGYTDVIHTLLKEASPFCAYLDKANVEGDYPIHLACASDNDIAFNHIVTMSRKYNHVDKNGHTPLMLLAKKNAVERAELLLSESELDLMVQNIEGKTARALAVELNHQAFVAAIDKAAADRKLQ